MTRPLLPLSISLLSQGQDAAEWFERKKCEKHRLGDLFADLFEFWLRFCPLQGWVRENVHSSVQIFKESDSDADKGISKGKVTIGELDFILQVEDAESKYDARLGTDVRVVAQQDQRICDLKEIWHLEATVKYLLVLPGDTWLGGSGCSWGACGLLDGRDVSRLERFVDRCDAWNSCSCIAFI